MKLHVLCFLLICGLLSVTDSYASQYPITKEAYDAFITWQRNMKSRSNRILVLIANSEQHQHLIDLTYSLQDDYPTIDIEVLDAAENPFVFYFISRNISEPLFLFLKHARALLPTLFGEQTEEALRIALDKFKNK